MKTLDEVIKACEETVSDVDRGVDIEGCYLGATETRDALHYLKEYQETKKHLACLDDAEIRGDNTQVVNNPPLTWDELCTMEGKPVWIECSQKAWGLNDGTFVDAFGDDCITIKVLHDLWHFQKKQIGKTWQAYRKKRTDGLST